MAQNRKFQFTKEILLSGPFDFIFVSGPKLTSKASFEVGRDF